MVHGADTANEGEVKEGGSQETSPNGEALLRARLLKIELPSTSTSYASDHHASTNGGGSGNSYLYSGGFYCEGKSPKSTPSTPLYDAGTSSASGAHFDAVGGGKLNCSFGSSGISVRTSRAEDEPCHYSYLHSRKMEYDQCTQECTRVFTATDPLGLDKSWSNGLFIGGDAVARNRELLSAHDITHVVNCCGYVSKNYFEEEEEEEDAEYNLDDSLADEFSEVLGDEFSHIIDKNGDIDKKRKRFMYMTLWLEDSPTEEIIPVLYKVFDFITKALYQRDHRAPLGGPYRRKNVLVHCTQGVSRSVSLCIAYIMHRTGDFDYERTFRRVKGLRSIANPNIGFVCQLLHWGKRLAGIANARSMAKAASSEQGDLSAEATSSSSSNGYESLRVFRMAPQSKHDPSNIVAKLVHQPSSRPSTSQSSKHAVPGPSSSSASPPPSFDPQVFDSRYAFIVQVNSGESGGGGGGGDAAAAQFVWIGNRCEERLRRGANFAAASFRFYEWYCSHEIVKEGEEPSRLRSMMSGRQVGTENSAYDEDYDILKAYNTAQLGTRRRSSRRRPPADAVADGGCEMSAEDDSMMCSDDVIDSGAPSSYTPLSRTLSLQEQRGGTLIG